MSNELMINKKPILNRILVRIKRQNTSLEGNVELYSFLKERYSEEKRIIGIIPIRVFGKEQLDKITGLDISREDYIKSLKGIEELQNLQELYCRLGIEFDYDSVCEALSNERLQSKRLSIKSPEQLDGYDLSRLPEDVKLVGYDFTKEYEIKNGVILEKKEAESSKSRQITGQNMKQLSNEDSLIEPERQEEYNYIMKMREKVRNGKVSSDDVKQLSDIAFGKDSIESQQVSSAIVNRGKIKESIKECEERKSWELEPEEEKRIQNETAESGRKYCEKEEYESGAKNEEQARS